MAAAAPTGARSWHKGWLRGSLLFSFVRSLLQVLTVAAPPVGATDLLPGRPDTGPWQLDLACPGQEAWWPAAVA